MNTHEEKHYSVDDLQAIKKHYDELTKGLNK